MDEVKKSRTVEYNIPSLEPFRAVEDEKLIAACVFECVVSSSSGYFNLSLMVSSSVSFFMLLLSATTFRTQVLLCLPLCIPNLQDEINPAYLRRNFIKYSHRAPFPHHVFHFLFT
jgi:hypothetical protein